MNGKRALLAAGILSMISATPRCNQRNPPHATSVQRPPAASPSATTSTTASGPAGDDRLLRLISGATDTQKAGQRLAIIRALRGRVNLSHGSDTVGYAADQVYFCRELSGPDALWCLGGITHADDTVHTMEFPHSVILADPGLRFGFVDAYGRPIEPMKVAYLPPGAHSKKSARAIVTGSGFSLQHELKGEPIVLFAIFPLGTAGFTKHVWVVDSLL